MPLLQTKLAGSMPAKKEVDTSTYRGRFAVRMRQLRAGRDVSQVLKVLKKSGHEISRATYYNWESATYDPPLDILPSLAKAFGVKLIELFPEA